MPTPFLWRRRRRFAVTRPWGGDVQPRPWWPVWTALTVLVVATALLLPSLHGAPPGFLARPLGRSVVVAGYAALAAVTFLLYYIPRRRENRPFSLVAGGVCASLAAALGFLIYLPCTSSETPGWTALYHTMTLFVGATYEPFSGTGTVCSAMPVGLEVARIMALAVALGALVAVLLRLFVEQVDRLRVWAARDIVLVTGLAPETEDFIARLPRAFDGGSRAGELAGHPDAQLRELAAHVLEGERRLKAEVALVEPNRGHPSLPGLRQAGVRVILGDPDRLDSVGLMRSARRVRAAYLVSADSARNILLAKQLLALLVQHQAPRGAVPAKILVRVDDSRDAEEFRRQCMSVSTRTVIIDTFGPEQVTCQEIAVMTDHSLSDAVVLLGSTSLTATLLDEMAQAARERRAEGSSEEAPRVVVVDPRGRSLVHDHVERQRWHANTPLFSLDVVDADVTEQSLVRAVGEAEYPFVVDCRGPGVEGALLAHRCVQLWPLATVLHPDRSAKGVERDAGVTGLHRFAPSLLRRGDLPEDRWMRVARIMHLRYVSRHGMVMEPGGRRPWDLLSDFYRMSNLRALTHAMQMASSEPFNRIWRPISEEQQPAPLSQQEIDQSLAIEHEDWRRYYLRHGWEYARVRDDAARKHPMLLGWDELTAQGPGSDAAGTRDPREQVRGTVSEAFELLAVLGYRPYRNELSESHPSMAERRVSRWARTSTSPTYFSEVLTEPTDWEFNGESLTAHRGDVRVGDAAGSWGWSLRQQDRNRTYVGLADGTYRRNGWVVARRAEPGEVLETTEGRETAAPGDWLVRDDFGQRWFTADARFRATHAPLHGPDPLERMTHDGHTEDDVTG